MKPTTRRSEMIHRILSLQLMKEGAKWQLFIPPDLAYRRRGALEDQTLIFDVELISIQPAK